VGPSRESTTTHGATTSQQSFAHPPLCFGGNTMVVVVVVVKRFVFPAFVVCLFVCLFISFSRCVCSLCVFAFDSHGPKGDGHLG
jgi:hypothetical protein